MWYTKGARVFDTKEVTEDEIQRVKDEEERLMAEAL
jgi:hypothetical protein